MTPKTPLRSPTRKALDEAAEAKTEEHFREQAAAILNPPEPLAEAKAVKPLRIASFPR